MTGLEIVLNWRNGREISMKPINLHELRLGFGNSSINFRIISYEIS
jgi:hypothetical protein